MYLFVVKLGRGFNSPSGTLSPLYDENYDIERILIVTNKKEKSTWLQVSEMLGMEDNATGLHLDIEVCRGCMNLICHIQIPQAFGFCVT